MPDAQDPHERSPTDPPSAPAWEMPSDDALLSFAISRLIERRTALPALRHSDLGQLIQRHRIFPGFGATFLQTAPDNLLRTGLGELARQRTVGLAVLAYHAAFTYPEVLTQLAEAIGTMEGTSSPDALDNADDGAGEVAYPDTTEPDASMAQLATGTSPGEPMQLSLCVYVIKCAGVESIRAELETYRPRANRSVVRRGPVRKIATPKSKIMRIAPPPDPAPPVAVLPVAISPDTTPGVGDIPAGMMQTGLPQPDTDSVDVVTPGPLEVGADASGTQPLVIALDESTPDPVEVNQVPFDAVAPVKIPSRMDIGEQPPDDARAGHEDRGPLGHTVPKAVGTESFTPTDLGALLATIEALPTEACDWDAVGNFAVALHNLQQARLAELREGDARTLRLALERIVAQHRETFDAWGLTTIGDASLWSPEVVAPDDRQQVATILTELARLLATWHAIRDEGEPAVLDRREAYRSRIRSAEKAILTRYTTANTALQPRRIIAPAPTNQPPAMTPEPRSVVVPLLHDGLFALASRVIRAAGTDLADVADLCDLMQRRLEFEFSRPLTIARAIADRSTASLRIRNASSTLVCDLDQLMVQPANQSTTNWQLAELFWNADVCLRHGRIADFLGRMWNAMEMALRLRAELVAGRRITDLPTAQAWWNELEPESPVRKGTCESKHFGSFEKDGLMSVRGCIAILQGLEEAAVAIHDWAEVERLNGARTAVCVLEPIKQLRNDSLIAHGTIAISEDAISRALGRSTMRQQDLRIPATLTGTAEVAWIYRQVMTDLGVHLSDENPILAMGCTLAGIVEPARS